ncbi:hypothetical protein ACFQZ4_06490 [Catellatospora coxensis]
MPGITTWSSGSRSSSTALALKPIATSAKPPPGSRRAGCSASG